MLFSLLHHPPFLHSLTLLGLPPGSWPCSQKGAHLIASRFRHTRWVSERIRRNEVHARTKREIWERQKEERAEGSTDTPTSLPLSDVRYIRRVLPTKNKNKKKRFQCALQPAIFLLKLWRSTGTLRRHTHPPIKPQSKTPHTKKHNFKHVSSGATHASV